MQALYEGPNGEAWKRSKIQFYGWVNFSGNISTSHPGGKTSRTEISRLIYDLRPNRMELNQIVLYIERLPDENRPITSIGVFESHCSTASIIASLFHEAGSATNF